MKKLVLIIIALFATPSTVSAQTLSTSDAAIWITDSEFNDPDFTDEDASVQFEFEEQVGYGVSFNRFWVSSFSTEFAYHKFAADLDVSIDDGPSFDGGEVDAASLTGIAQWHFRRASRFSPYIGAGVAYVAGEFEPVDEDVTIDFENEFTWAANFGANIGLTERLALGLDAKFIHWEPREEGDDASDRVELSPVLLSAGLRYRF